MQVTDARCGCALICVVDGLAEDTSKVLKGALPGNQLEFEELFSTVPGTQYEKLDWIKMIQEARVELAAGRINQEEFQAIEDVAKKGQAFEQDAIVVTNTPTPANITTTAAEDNEAADLQADLPSATSFTMGGGY